MEINRKQILESFLETMEGISDKEYQKRIWIRGEGPECDDFDETCNYFFDIGDPILKKYKDYGLTIHQYRLLKKFRHKFSAFSDVHSYELEFIETPEWAKIMEMAKEVLKEFDYLKK
jgi:hypothetical protein